MSEVVVSERRRVPAIWLVPIVALVLGLSVVIYTVMNQGPEIRIGFATAEGLEAGKTKIRARSVEVVGRCRKFHRDDRDAQKDLGIPFADSQSHTQEDAHAKHRHL